MKFLIFWKFFILNSKALALGPHTIWSSIHPHWPRRRVHRLVGFLWSRSFGSLQMSSCIPSRQNILYAIVCQRPSAPCLLLVPRNLRTLEEPCLCSSDHNKAFLLSPCSSLMQWTGQGSQSRQNVLGARTGPLHECNLKWWSLGIWRIAGQTAPCNTGRSTAGPPWCRQAHFADFPGSHSRQSDARDSTGLLLSWPGL